MPSWWRRGVGPSSASSSRPESFNTAGDPVPPTVPFLDVAFWTVLARGPSDSERRERALAMESGQSPDQLLQALIASPEFRLIYDAYAGRGERTGRKPADVEAGLEALGPPQVFTELAYRSLLGRDGDETGVAYYVSRLEDGAPRQRVLQALVTSDEFERRFRELCPDIGVLPRDIQLCELANPAKWDNPEWVDLLASLQTMAVDKMSMHRKGYEFAQLLFGLTKLDRLGENARVLSVGAGHEAPLYWLANRVGFVVATDMYDLGWKGAWASEGDDGVLKRPEDYAPFPYRREKLVFLKMDGRRLAFGPGTFDIVYSLSSIEHFGGLAGAIDAMDDMIRVLKPGGLLVLATEYCLSGPVHHEAFQPGEVRQLLARPGVRLVQPVDEGVHTRYEMAAVDIRRNPFQTPHMAVRDGDTVFTSVVAFLEKAGAAS